MRIFLQGCTQFAGASIQTSFYNRGLDRHIGGQLGGYSCQGWCGQFAPEEAARNIRCTEQHCGLNGIFQQAEKSEKTKNFIPFKGYIFFAG